MPLTAAITLLQAEKHREAKPTDQCWKMRNQPITAVGPPGDDHYQTLGGSSWQVRSSESAFEDFPETVGIVTPRVLRLGQMRREPRIRIIAHAQHFLCLRLQGSAVRRCGSVAGRTICCRTPGRLPRRCLDRRHLLLHRRITACCRTLGRLPRRSLERKPLLCPRRTTYCGTL